MSVNYYEDLFPRNVPTPAPLIEIAAKPLVPEVSLLLDQDKNKSSNSTNNPILRDNDYNTNNPPVNAYRFTHVGNKEESYNSWKTKNAQVLHDVTGSQEKLESARGNARNFDWKRSHRPNNPDNLEFDSINARGPTAINTQIAHRVNPDRIMTNSNNIESPSQRYQYYPSHDTSHKPPEKSTAFISKKDTVIHLDCQDRSCGQLRMDCCQQTSPLNLVQNQHLCEGMCVQQKIPSNVTHQNVCNDVFAKNVAYQGCKQNPNRVKQPYTKENYDECSNKCRLSNDCLNAKQIQNDTLQMPNLKLISPLDLAHINNQTVIDLYQIIHMQNEQILMLQQQVKQVLQIHLNCELSLKNKIECHNRAECSCNSGNNCCSNPNKIIQPVSPVSLSNEKRSIGIMTNSDEIDHQINDSKKCDMQKMKQKQKTTLSDHPTSQQTLKKNPTNLKKEKQRNRTTSNRTGKQNKAHLQSSQVDNSFSLNEADLIIKTTAEQDYESPNNSVHVDLPDYCSSSDSEESDENSASSSSDEGSDEFDSEGESSDPQLGWTFYNRVVGQVNNILKKTPTTLRQEQMREDRNTVNQMYIGNRDYETENNWSKRVTFDGPGLEDSDPNMPNMMPRFHQLKQPKDPRPSGPGRMQDFMMYNIANGNTNLSFATLRYLKQYQLLPSQPGFSVPENSPPSKSNKPSKNKKTKVRSRTKEVYNDMQFRSRKKASDATTSKLLDITALKQQPKLF